MSSVFSITNIHNEFDYIVTDYSQIKDVELNYIHSHKGEAESDTQLLLKGGKSWIVNPLKNYQPLSYQVLEEYASDYMVGFHWFRFPPNPNVPKNKLHHHGFFVVKERVIWASVRSDLESVDSFPKELKDSWLKNVGGWGVSKNGVPWHPRMLVGGTNYYYPLDDYASLVDKEWRKTLLPSLQEKIPNVYVTQTNPHDGSKSEWPAFRCFLDSRLPGDDGLIGDQLYVVDENPDRRVYWIKDFDFKNIYYLNNPAEAIDAYSAHTLLQKPERFDFSPWGVRL